jgi:hypothetical protein
MFHYLVVEYGPEFEIKDYEPVLILGLHSTLTCPIIGYPLVYFWKKLGSDSKEIIGEKEFSLPNEIGEYRYQCQAKMSNIMYPPVNFDVKVTEEANILKGNFSVFVNQLYLFHLKIDKNPKLPSEEEMGEVEIMIKNFGDRFILRCPSTQKQNYSKIEWWYQDGTENKTEIFVNGIFNENFNHIVKCINERNENKCEALEILNFNEKMVGEITKAYKSNDKDANCVFILTSFVKSLSMNCEEINTSNYCSIIDLDQASKKLFVKEDQLVDIQCSVTILSAVEMSPEYLGLHMSDCEDLDDEITSIYSIKYTGLQEYTFKTNCKRNFYRTDKSISCSILDFDRYSYLKSKVLDVVVEYGPIEENFDNDYFNKTISYGKSVVLKCPVNGYPISYIWKDDKSNKYSFGKYFTLHRHLETRLHEYECTAVIGKHSKQSKSYKFFININ